MHNNTNKKYRSTALFLLTVVYGFNFIDRQIVGILAPFIQADLNLTNTQLGLLIGLAFAAFYTIMGIPIAIMADRYNRVNIISISLAVWSFFTALTGYAQNFLHIGLARIGVGIGEAGGSPPSHSIISDLYNKKERASALGIFSLGIPLGIMAAYFTTATLIGKDPSDVNWRRIFIILGVAGIVLAIILRIVVREPVRGAQDLSENSTQDKPKLSENIATLLKIKSWWFMCFGITLASFASYSFSAFQTKFIRLLDPQYDFQHALIVLGVINGIAYAGGTVLGARLADYFAKKSVRAYALVPALAILIALPFALMAFWATSMVSHFIWVTLLLTVLGAYLGPSFAIAQTLAPITARATSTALFFLILNMIALGCGPTLAGILIDYFGHTNNPLESVRMSLSVISLSFILSIIGFVFASMYLPRDWKNAEDRLNKG